MRSEESVENRLKLIESDKKRLLEYYKEGKISSESYEHNLNICVTQITQLKWVLDK